MSAFAGVRGLGEDNYATLLAIPVISSHIELSTILDTSGVNGNVHVISWFKMLRVICDR